MDNNLLIHCLNKTLQEMTDARAEKSKWREQLSADLRDLDLRIETLDALRTQLQETPDDTTGGEASAS